MRHRFNTEWPDLIGFARPASQFAGMSRLLLLLAFLVLMAIPFTQQIWTWDRFLHGGQDFETTALLILTSLCLVLVLVQSCKQGIRLLITKVSWFFPPLRQLWIALPRRTSFDRNDGLTRPATAAYNVPLLI